MSKQTLLGNEAQIREFLDIYVGAVQTRDLPTLKNCYAKDVLAYDMLPPLRYQGIEAFGNLWEECLNSTEGQFHYEVSELSIHADEHIAFCNYLAHMHGDTKTGGKAEAWSNWMRTTVCFKKIDGQWCILHEHTSVPIDMESGKACTELKPD